jgi:predicted nucleotidyltransferase
MDFVRAKLELEDRLGRPVDLIDCAMVENPYRKASILRDLIPLYAA